MSTNRLATGEENIPGQRKRGLVGVGCYASPQLYEHFAAEATRRKMTQAELIRTMMANCHLCPSGDKPPKMQSAESGHRIVRLWVIFHRRDSIVLQCQDLVRTESWGVLQVSKEWAAATIEMARDILRANAPGLTLGVSSPGGDLPTIVESWVEL